MTSSEDLYVGFNQAHCKNKCGELVDVYWDIAMKCWCYQEGRSLCEKCRDSKYRVERKTYLIERAALTPEEGELTANSFHVTEATQEAHDTVRRMILGDKINLVLSGKAGRGKTHLACAVLNGRLEKPVKFLPVTRWLMEVRSNLKETSEDSIIERFLALDTVVLDDFGANKLTDWNLSFLDCVVDEWYRLRRKGLIVTSNFTLKQIAENISDRIASRLAQMAEMYELTGDDHRIS